MSEAPIRKRTVTVRPATILPFSQMPINGTTKRRVAAYARVSTDSDEQQTSYDAQVSHYTQYIHSNPEWEFAGLYADEGLSGLSMKNRDDFNRMIRDALDGKIDLILAKSISRFARNTVDTLNTVRSLKTAGVEVFFEKENIYTFDAKGELLITIMASLAQEESRSISENVTWGKRKRFEEGKFTLPYAQFLGYKKGADGMPEIVEEEAKIVRWIYYTFLQGKTVGTIAKQLTENGIPTPSGKQIWQASTVQSILSNEKYMGDAILQKMFTVDFLTKKMKTNEGEVDQYHHTGTHPAIIAPEVFEQVQREIERRKKLGRSYSGKDCFASRIVCGECGGLYGSKVWGSNTKYRRIVWRCNRKYGKGKQPCSTPHFTEDEIKRAFLDVYNRMLSDREVIVEACREAINMIADTTDLERRREKLHSQLEELATLMRSHISRNASEAQNQDEYTRKYNDLCTRFEKASEQAERITRELTERQGRHTELKAYLDAIEHSGDILVEFDERLWSAIIDTVTIEIDKTMAFRFKDGRELTWQ